MKSSLLFFVFVIGISAFGQVNINQGLLANYYFNGNANDSTINQYHGTVQGPTLTTDRFGNCDNAYLFNNFPHLIQLPHQIMNGISDFTMTVWIHLSQRDASILSAANFTIENEYFPYVMGNGNIRQHVKNNSTTGNENIPLNAWTHIALTRNGLTGSVSTFVNGVLTHTGNQQNGLFQVDPNGLFLGNDQDCLSGCFSSTNQYRGKMDDLRFYNRILNPSEINAIKNLPNFFGQGNISVINNDTLIACDFPLQLSANSGFSSYLWNTGSTGLTTIVNAPGKYSVTVTNSLGCQLRDTIVVVQNLIDLIQNDTIYNCNFPLSVNAKAGLNNYIWNTGSTSSTGIINQGGTFTVSATDLNGCTFYDTLVVIDTKPKPSLGNDLTICRNSNVTLDAGAGYISYLWSNGATSQTINVNGSIGLGTFLFSVVVTNSFACIGVDTINVTVDACLNVRDYNELTNINIFPNPSKEKITITVNNLISNVLEIKLYSIEGKEIDRWVLSNNKSHFTHEIEIKYPKGIYLLNFISEDKSISKKLIIE